MCRDEMQDELSGDAFKILMHCPGFVGRKVVRYYVQRFSGIARAVNLF